MGMYGQNATPANCHLTNKITNMEKKYTPCGGCGATDPIQRCIGCFHPFESAEEKKYPIGGYAPGDYWHKSCKTCENEFTGDKRAWQCEDCALADKAKFDALSAEQQEDLARIGKFIMEQPGLTPMVTGNGYYWPYKDVITLLTKYAEERKGATTSVYIPCHDDDPRACGSYTSTDGQCVGYIRESKVPVEQGAVWVRCSERMPGTYKVRFKDISGNVFNGNYSAQTGLFYAYRFQEPITEVVEWLDERGQSNEAGGEVKP
jgi:hypothetical protein